MAQEIIFYKLNEKEKELFKTYPDEVESRLYDLTHTFITSATFIYNFFKEKFGKRYWCLLEREDIERLLGVCKQVWSVDGRLWEIGKEKHKLSKQIEKSVSQMCDFTKPDAPVDSLLQTKVNILNDTYRGLIKEEEELSKCERCNTLLNNSYGLLGKSYYDDDFYHNVKTCIVEFEKMLSDFDEEKEAFLVDFSY